VNLEYTLPLRRGPRVRTFLAEPARHEQLRPPHTARILALALKLEDLLRSGVVTDYADLAHLGHLSAFAGLSNHAVVMSGSGNPGARAVYGCR
jgi:hypothetical protein